MQHGYKHTSTQVSIRYGMVPVLALLLLSLGTVRGQSRYTIVYHATAAGDTSLPARARGGLPRVSSDSGQLVQQLRTFLNGLQGQGYLEASVDSIVRRDSTLQVYLFTGRRYAWVRLRPGNIHPVMLQAAGWREGIFRDRWFDYRVFRQVEGSLLGYAEDHGYPFASVWLDSLVIADDRLDARLNMSLYRLITVDSIQAEGDVRISNRFLQHYLSIYKGDPYSQSKVRKIQTRLRELPFLQERRGAFVAFKNEKASVILTLEKKKASRFDFLLGLLPNPNAALTGAAGRALILTGTLNADFYNALGRGERLSAEFQQLRPETQQLKLRAAYPYLFNTALGAEGRFELYRRDTAHLDVASDLGLQYLMEGSNYLKFFWNRTATSLLSVDTLKIKATRRLPDLLDVGNNTFGLEGSWQRFDYRFNPRKGWSALLRAGAGIRNIRRNLLITRLEGGSQLYDSVRLNSLQYRFETRLEAYVPLLKRSTLRFACAGVAIAASQPVYRNEQYRLGGNRLLRGFDEDAFYATAYVAGTAEYRLLIGRNSFLFLFCDAAYIRNRTVAVSIDDRPLGFGAGMTFETPIGLFSIGTAVGSSGGAGFDLRATKIHFGYISLF